MGFIEFLVTLSFCYIGNIVGRTISVSNGYYNGKEPYAFKNMNHVMNVAIALFVWSLPL
ncbi:hypothetical protein VPHD484_0238 [Vibrio phage D484]